MQERVEILKAGLAARYRVGPEIGRGGMATVHRAHDLDMKREVAIKILRDEFAEVIGPARFLREIEIVKKLSHPAIVPMLASGDVNGVLYFVMPFIEGETLRARIQRDVQFPVADAIRISVDIADGLAFAHDQKVIHRDIKPENILLQEGRALITDFGIARVVDAADQVALSSSGLAIGTPVYMSPEQSLGSRDLDARSDIYSLGCVLYEMLAGEPPFAGRTAHAILARRMAGPPTPLRIVRSAVSEHLQRVVEKALAPTPSDRFPSAMLFKSALLADSDPITSRSGLSRWALGR